MLKITHKNDLGVGAYTIADVSRILKMPYPKVRRFINEYWDRRTGKEVFQDTYSWTARDNTKVVNFYVLIELFVFSQLRLQGVSTSRIHKARKTMVEETKHPYPFASRNVLTDGKKIWYEFEDSIVNTDGTRQTNFVEIIREFTKKIEFNENNVAERYYPAGKTSSIVVDPHHQFGLPVIKGTNINTDVIKSMLASGEKPETIRHLYDLSEKQLSDVVSFYRQAV